MELKKVVLISLLVLLTSFVYAQTVIINKSDIIEERNGRNFYIHTVQKGQTVYSISRAYNVSPDEIYFENPGSKDGISVNEILIIPTINKETELKKEVVATNFDFFYHVAANNETFDEISSIYIIPKKYIEKANPNLTSPLREGEYVKVPVEEAFDILDGKNLSSGNVANNYRVSNQTKTRPATTSYSKPTTTKTTSNSSGSTTQKPVNKPVKQRTTQKPPKSVSETVSFDPEIPVIQDYRHVVILGETTQSVAKKYDISVDLLKAANPGLGNTVKKGDRLRVPDKNKMEKYLEEKQNKESSPTLPEIQNPVINTNVDTVKLSDDTKKQETAVHIVKRKETLYSIGREYGITVDELIKANQGLTSNIKPGQKIIVPKKKISNPFIVHKVTSNSKASKIAKLYRIPIYQIRDFNPDIGSRVYRNQEIKIPVGSKAFIVPLTELDKTVNEEMKSDELPEDYGNINHNCDFTPDYNKTYKVALLIPLSLEEADSLNKEQFFLKPQQYFKPFRFIQFYEGALLALDSLAKQGINIEFYVYDVDKNITKTIKVLKQKELRTMDLIIGPFFNNSFNQVAFFAGNFNIPIVNPLSYREAVVNNYKTVIKIKPGVYSQKDMLMQYINTHAPNCKTFLISQTSYLDADIITDINNEIKSIQNNQVKIDNNELLELSYEVAKRDSLYDENDIPPPFLIEGTEIYPNILENSFTDSTIINNFVTRINYSVDSLYPFKNLASPLRKNLVILYGSKKSFILDVLNRLNETRDTFDIELIGMPTWERINNLNNNKMNNLNLTYFSSTFIDYELDKNENFIEQFRSDYNTEPDSYAYSGFDITYYFINALFYLGDNFTRCLEHFPMELLQGQYKFNRVGNTHNFENNYWNMLQIKQMTKIKIPDYLLQKSNYENEEDNFN